MKILPLVLLSLTLAISCSKKGEDGPPKPFTGKLTGERIMGVKGLVKPFLAWDKGYALILSRLGQPTLQKKNYYYWSLLEGDTCYEFYMSQENEKKYFKDKKNPGLMVGTVSHPGKWKKDGPVFNWKNCTEHAKGKK
ncbi:hypothetical protein KKF84_03685 [Myxococcota bacterium]|nr:hypothetical protein [Myxococcota bacterium]